jgi:uncharacterized protein (TIGR02145 family)
VGIRNHSIGSLDNVGIFGYYWSSTLNGAYSRSLGFNNVGASMYDSYRAIGYAVRCIKETPATIGALNCGSIGVAGNLISGQAISGASITVPYTGGNGGYYAAQSIPSTGVTGLTATLPAGVLANGSGNLVYTVSGTASGAGTASFALNVGGQICSFSVTVQTLISQYPVGSIFCAAGATAIVDVTNPTTGKTWMDRNLGAAQVATSSTDVNAYGDLYQWGRRSDGHQCRTSSTTTTLSSSDQPGNGSFILASTTPIDWRSPQNNNLWQGVNGVNNPCPSGYKVPSTVEFESERQSWNSNNYLGALSSVLKLPVSGRRFQSTGILLDVGTGGNYFTSTINSTVVDYLLFQVPNNNALVTVSNRAMGMTVRCIKETVATVGALNCGSATTTGNLFNGQAATGVSISVPYTGGNGGYYAAQTVNSTGVSGLTASIASGLLVSGSGTLVYSISGTPSNDGIASFNIMVGGQFCSFTISVYATQPAYPVGSVFCASGATIVVDVTNPTTGKTWMDRNLGATQTAISETDAAAYGDLYQWGRGSDGHQCRNSATTTIQSSTDQPGNGNFIFNTSNWRNPNNNNLWQGVNGVNNPCPSGYRLPTFNEIDQERLSWSAQNSSGAFASALKFSKGGLRDQGSGTLQNVGISGHYWTSTINGGSNAENLRISGGNANFPSDFRKANGTSVRCIKHTVATFGSLNCGGSTQTGIVYSGQAASGISVSLPYTGGNGGFQATLVYNSTGVTGLTATMSSVLIANGSGNLVFTISGTPSAGGMANFAVSIGGQSCTFFVTVTDLAAQYQAGSVFCTSGPTVIVDVNNPTTGKTWMDRNLGASQAATSSTDVAAYGDLYQWGRGNDGHQCRTSATTATLSSTDQPGNGNFILAPNTPFDWRSPQNVNLWQGVNGINNPCPSGYRLPSNIEFSSEVSTWSSNNSSGAIASQLKFPAAGNRPNASVAGEGSNGHYWTSTVNGTSSLRFSFSSGSISASTRSIGTSVRCIKETTATLGSLNCGGASQAGIVYSGQAASGVSVTLPYTGGNGGFQVAQVTNSAGVTGLTAALPAGLVANGSGNVVFTITGTPSAAGTANFTVNIGGQSCTFSLNVSSLIAQYPVGSVFCASGATVIVDVTNPTTGKTWMDRNLGATQVATSSTDALAYGDLYQWGRGNDGHQCRNSATTATLSSSDQPGNGNFILPPTTPNDWRSPQNTNLWQGVNGVNNPCPSGYRVPTDVELDAERISWATSNAAGGFSSVLKFPAGGSRSSVGGALNNVGVNINLWTSKTGSTTSACLNAGTTFSGINSDIRADGRSIRCIKN